MPKSDLVNQMDEIQAKLRPLLKDEGYRVRGRTFNRTTHDGLTQVLNFQMGSFDPPGTTYIPGLRENLYGKFTVNLVQKIYGPSSEMQNDDGDNATGSVDPIFKTSIHVKPITNLDLGYQATKEIKLNVGAINLFNEYPNQVNSTVLAHERAADDNAAVQIYPSFSPFGINGGYYYAKATYSF